jgi:hypothetical protein
MALYCCYFLDEHECIRAVEAIDVDSVSKAIERGLEMLQQRPHHRAIELWLGARRLYPFPPRQAA